ncbi:hypothetical protein HY404_01825 [Candidatus Microgenomates bacterium]|nr:hypothetical protein [Candidatus Microgenomates bacterium]
MHLPRCEDVLISKEKLLNYVLSETHSTGRFKAKFFHKVGFTKTKVDLLEQTLRKIARVEAVKEEIMSEYGVKYVIDGEINAPVGKTVKVRTIWIVEKGQTRLRFVTVYPV